MSGRLFGPAVGERWRHSSPPDLFASSLQGEGRTEVYIHYLRRVRRHSALFYFYSLLEGHGTVFHYRCCSCRVSRTGIAREQDGGRFAPETAAALTSERLVRGWKNSDTATLLGVCAPRAVRRSLRSTFTCLPPLHRAASAVLHRCYAVLRHGFATVRGGGVPRRAIQRVGRCLN